MKPSPWSIAAVALALVSGMPMLGFASSFKVLHTFNSSTDGAGPRGALILDKAGNVYGTTLNGGLYGGGTVFELGSDGNGNWTETILHNFQFPGGADGTGPQSGLAMDAQGNLYGTTEIGGISNGYCPSGCGVVFELSPGSSGWAYQVIYSFSGVPDGSFPIGELIFDTVGNLYGVTTGGGIYHSGYFAGNGTVFELVKTTGWQELVLHRFTYSPADGQYPSGKLLFDSHGNLYGTTESGGRGSYGWYHGTAFEMTPLNGTWSERVIYNFCSQVNCSDGNQPSGGVIDINGRLYGTATLGGGSGYNGTAFELKKSGTSWSADSYVFDITDGAQPWAPLLRQGGAVYGVTEQGGIQNGACTLFQMGNGVVFKMAVVSNVVTETVLYEFTGGSDGCGPVGGLVADASGNLYGTTSSGNSGGNTNGGVVFELTP